MRSITELARRRQIIEAAINVMARDGYHSTSFSRIAKEANISKSIITYHFSGKDEIFEQLFLKVAEDAGAYMTPHLETAGSAQEMVSTYITRQLVYMADHRNELLAIGQLAANHGGPLREPDYIAQARQKELSLLQSLFERGQKNNEFRNFDTHIMAVVLTNAIKSMLTEWALQPEVDLKAAGAELSQLFARGMMKDNR